MQLPNGEYEQFVAERMPQQLDDEIKKVKMEFHRAAGKMTPKEVQDLIPITFPVTHTMQEFPFISEYPIDKWEKAGKPCFSKRSWYKLVMLICQNDMDSLRDLLVSSKTKLDAANEEMDETMKKQRLDAGGTAASSSGERA